MERPEHDLDRQFRRRLQHAEATPPPFVWKGVQAVLRRRRRRIVLWWSAGLFLMGAVGVGLWLWLPAPAAHSPASADKGGGLIHVPSATGSRPAAEDVAVMSAPVVSRAPALPSASLSAKRSETAHTQYLLPPLPGTPQPLAEPEPTPPDPTVEDPVSPETTSEPGTLPTLTPEPLHAAPRSVRLTAALLAQKKPGSPSTKRCYSFSSKGGVWMLDAYGGPAWSRVKWRVHNSELDTYAAARRRTETPDGAFNAGLRASYFIHPNLMLRTGLHYDQWVERFEYFDPNFIRYHVVITQKIINGQWVSVTDTVGVEYGSEYQKTYNRFGLLDIPLQIGTEWRRGVMGFSLNAGASINVLFHKRGHILDTAGQPVSFTPGSGGLDVYRPRVGWSAGGSIQAFYHVAPRTRLFAEPYFRIVLRPITLPAYPIEQRQSIAGLRIGVSQILDRK